MARANPAMHDPKTYGVGTSPGGLPELSSSKILGSTLPECFYRRALRNPQRPLYFTKRLGNWEPMTYGQCLDFVFRAMAGLKRLGFQKGDKIVIFSENRFEWILTDYAAQWLGGATAAIYTTSTPEQIRYILNESEATTLFVSGESLLRKLDGISGLSSLKYVLAYDPVSNRTTPPGTKFVPTDEFLAGSIESAEAEEYLKKISPEDLAVLLYTSGTTGEPKAVMISHRNLVANLNMFVESMPIEEGKVTISFLPLSHIYERAIHNLMVSIGLYVYFAESIEKLLENISEVRPQVMTAVPRIFEKMYTKINERVKNAPFIRRSLFYWAQSVGRRTFPYRYRSEPMPFTLSLLNSIADLLVFKKIRSITGGRAEMFISGGAPISTDIQEFFFRAGFRILEGYGISETCILTVNRMDRFKFGTVGIPFSKTEIKIAEDGEILVKGPQVMRGYYKRPDADKEAFNSEGWYLTGDIGEFDADGFLKITDRKKELIITAGGKNIAPQPIENALKKDSLVEAACLVGDRRKFVTALIVPSWEVARAWGEARGQKWGSLHDAIKSPLLLDRIRAEIEKLNLGLPQYSTIKDFRLIPTPFSIDAGELTPTMKLKRRVIQQKYRDLIDSMYPADGTSTV